MSSNLTLDQPFSHSCLLSQATMVPNKNVCRVKWNSLSYKRIDSSCGFSEYAPILSLALTKQVPSPHPGSLMYLHQNKALCTHASSWQRAAGGMNSSSFGQWHSASWTFLWFSKSQSPESNVGMPLSNCVKVSASLSLPKPRFSHLLMVNGHISNSLSGLLWE